MASFMTFVTVVFFILFVPVCMVCSYPLVLLFTWFLCVVAAPRCYNALENEYAKLQSICNTQDEYLKIHSKKIVGITGKTVGEIQEMLSEYIYKEEHRERKHSCGCNSAAEWQEYLQKKIDKSLPIILPRKYAHIFGWGELFPPFEFKKDLEIDLLKSKLECRKNAYLNLLTDLLWEYSYANGWQEVLDGRFDCEDEKKVVSIHLKNYGKQNFDCSMRHISLKREHLISPEENKEFNYDKAFLLYRFDQQLKVCFRGRWFEKNEVVDTAINEIVKPFCETFMQYFVDLSQIKDDNNHRIISL